MGRQIDGLHILYVKKVKIVDFSYVIVGQITEGKIKKREELDQSRRVSDQWCMDAYSVSCMFTARKA